MKENNKPKILIFDIETSPNLSYTWGKYDQNVIEFKEEWYMLSFAYKWLGEKKVHGFKLNDFSLYKKDKTNDLELCNKLWELLDSADIVIGHNSISFDIRKLNARFLYHSFKPFSDVKNIDTYRIAKQYFKFNENGLNALGQHLKLGEKIPHTGFKLWKQCMSGDKKAWNLMMKYNKGDVRLTEKLYMRFLPYIKNHPNYGLYLNKQFACPNCGENKLQKNGFYMTRISKFQRYRCMECGASSSSRFSEKGGKPDIK